MPSQKTKQAIKYLVNADFFFLCQVHLQKYTYKVKINIWKKEMCSLWNQSFTFGDSAYKH